ENMAGKRRKEYHRIAISGPNCTGQGKGLRGMRQDRYIRVLAAIQPIDIEVPVLMLVIITLQQDIPTIGGPLKGQRISIATIRGPDHVWTRYRRPIGDLEPAVEIFVRCNNDELSLPTITVIIDKVGISRSILNPGHQPLIKVIPLSNEIRAS